MKILHNGYTLTTAQMTDGTIQVNITKIIGSKLYSLNTPIQDKISLLGTLLHSDLLKSDDNFRLVAKAIKDSDSMP